MSAALFGSLALAAAPKCPFCLLALAGLGGSAAALAPAYATWLLPVTVLLLATVVALLAWRPRAGYGPAALASAASLALLAAKFGAGSTSAIAAAGLVLAAAAAWNLWPRSAGEPGCACDPSPAPDGPATPARSGG